MKMLPLLLALLSAACNASANIAEPHETNPQAPAAPIRKAITARMT